MFLCVRGFLRELLQEVEKGNLYPRGWLGSVNKFSGPAKTKQGGKATEKLGAK